MKLLALCHLTDKFVRTHQSRASRAYEGVNRHFRMIDTKNYHHEMAQKREAERLANEKLASLSGES